MPGAGYIVDSYSTNASINPDGDVDNYNFRAAVAGEITVILRNQGGNPAGDANTAADDDLVLERLDSVGTVIGGPFAVNAPGLRTSFTVTGVTAGEQFWVRVRGADTDDANYQVEFVNRDREDDLGGNNNTQAAATPLGTFGSIPAANLQNYTITSPDKDYFSFVVPANTPGELAVSASMPAGSGAASGATGPTNLGLRIRNPAGTVIASSNGTVTAVDTATITVPNSASPTTYFIEVYSGSLGQVNRYDLAITANPVLTGTLSGFKFNDLNADGLWDEGEPPLSNVQINLDLNNDAMSDASVNTNAGGAYVFSNVPLGTHRIFETIPANSLQSLPGPAGNFSYVIDINEHALVLDHLDFGNYQLDFGDAPDPTFPTLLANDGARHVINPALFMGVLIDAELDGQPNPTATGDDLAGLDDEDGITQTNVWTLGNSATYNVTSSGYAFLNAWVDFNNNGSWADAGEQVAVSVPVAPGPNPLSFAVPGGAALGAVNTRFRLSTTPVLGVTGLAPDGEVEDHRFQIFAPATIQFQSAAFTVPETVGTTAINLVLSIPGGGTLSNAVSIDVLNTPPGTATVVSDYSIPSPQTVTFPAGSVNGAVISTLVPLSIVNDLLAENDETVNFDLSNLVNSGGQVTIGTPNDLTVTIDDSADRAAVSVRFLAPASSTVAEANVNHPVAVELVTTGGVTLGVPVTVSVTDVGTGTATSGADFTAVGTINVVFPASSGNGATQNANVGILDDTIAENDETIHLGLSSPTPFGTIVASAAHTVTITDASDRSNVAVRFSAATSSVAEANAAHNVAAQLVMTGGITSIGAPITVNVSDLLTGTATSGADYSAYAGQTLTFPTNSVNNATQNATLGILDDLLAELDETVNLSLSGVTGPGVLGAPAAHQVTITDSGDRSLVSVHFQVATSNAPEGTPSHSVVVELVAAGGITLAAPVSVNVTDALTGTATSGGVDYTYSPNPKLVTFASGSGNGATQNVSMTIVDDPIFENPDETVNLAVSFVSGPAAGVSASTTHVVTIVDNDTPTVSIVQTTHGNEAGPINGLFTISISPLSASATTVNYAVGGTATNGTDYTLITSPIIIPAHTASVTLPILVTNDNRIEGTETVTVNLTSVTAGVSIDGIANNAQVNILDNDTATIAFSSPTYSTSEAASPANLVVNLVLSTNGAGTVEIQYPITVDVNDQLTGTATSGGVDYTFSPNPTTVTFPALSGAGSQNVPVTIINDGNPEPNETVNFVLQNLTGPVTFVSPTSTTLTITNDDFAAVQGRKYHDLDSDGTDDGGTDPGLAGWTIQLYSDVNGNNSFEPNIYVGGQVGGVLLVAGADGDPIATAVTDASGNYQLGNATLATGRVFVTELQKQGWTQTSAPAFYSFIHTVNVPDLLKDFGNATCTDTLNAVNGTYPYLTTSKGVLTIELIGSGTFTVDKGVASFTSYTGAGSTVSGTSAASRSSEYAPRETGRQRVDLLVNAGELVNINVLGAGAGATLRIVNSVNVDTTSSLALQITGTACGETIFVADDPNFAATSDAKRIYIGATTGAYDAGVDLAFAGVEYDAALINAMFGNPTISRVDINALGGDDVVRIADDTIEIGAKVTQQSTILGGDGNDILRAGAGKSTITAGAGHDFVVGGAADDTIYGGAGNDYLYGLDGADLINGDDGDDWIAGGNGDDPLLRGGNGNDFISGGAGRDRLLGDAGAGNVAYRDTTDLSVTGFAAANIFFVPPNADAVQNKLDDMVDRIWQDHFLANGNDDASLDTLDELFKSLLP